jgi:hypothetical protein
MTVARAQLVDVAVTRWYHCIARCVRGASLLREGGTDRQQWIQNRLEELAQIFSISVGAFAVLESRLHVLARIDCESAQAWSDEEVVRRWARLSPPRGKKREPLPVSAQWVRAMRQDRRWVATARERLQSLGWFMKSLKEPLSRLANRQEGTRGFFFEGRFKTVAILDEESLVATSVYIDLTPIAAGCAETPEASAYTSLRLRVEHQAAQGRSQKRGRTRGRKRAALDKAARREDSLWLCPIEDRRAFGSLREGMLENFAFENYRLLAQYSGELCCTGNAPTSTQLTATFDRLGSSATTWQERLGKLWDGRLLGRNFAASRDRLREVAKRLGIQKINNLAGCPTR